jgi:tetratricopeptide (TPR) repeat protein
VWPIDLAVHYPLNKFFQGWSAMGAAVLLIGIFCMALRWRRQKPYIGVGWLWYVLTLLPVIGLIYTGPHRMADRYTYLPLIGLFIPTVWGIHDVLKRRRCGKGVMAVTASAVLCVLMILSGFQARYWKNSITLFDRAIAVNGDSYFTHNSLGEALAQQGRLDEAADHFFVSLQLKPNYSLAHNNMGVVLAQRGKLDEAIIHFTEALKYDPNFVKARQNLDHALRRNEM